jgi:hypothetical protein
MLQRQKNFKVTKFLKCDFFDSSKMSRQKIVKIVSRTDYLNCPRCGSFHKNVQSSLGQRPPSNKDHMSIKTTFFSSYLEFHDKIDRHLKVPFGTLLRKRPLKNDPLSTTATIQGLSYYRGFTIPNKKIICSDNYNSKT